MFNSFMPRKGIHPVSANKDAFDIMYPPCQIVTDDSKILNH